MVIGEYSQSWQRQVEAAGQRYAQTELERQEVAQKRKETGSVVVDDEEQIVARCERLMDSGEVPLLQAAIEVGKAHALDELTVKERIIGIANELQGANFLPRGARAAATVGRISLLRNGREIPQGTGSLISPQLLLTNNHVLPDAETARQAVIEFGAELDVENAPTVSTRFRLDPDALFVTDVRLDFTVVLVAAGDGGRKAGEVVGGWNSLIVTQGKIVIGESMNVIGHPMGRLKEISIRSNRLDLQLDEFLHYSTDTEPGNSGSPVFNDQWEVVALHHSGVPKTDSKGRTLRRDGGLWRTGDGDDAVDWIANEGVRISVILKHLAGVELDAGRRGILAEIGPSSGITATPVESETALQRPANERTVAIEAFTRGVKARPSAFGGTRHLLFLHGRGQQGRNPDELRRIWTAGLNQGLTLAGLGTVDPADVNFPFYGDVLLAPGAREALDADAEDSALYEQLIAEAAAELGMPAEVDGTDLAADEGLRGFGSGLLGKVHQQLSWIAARSGLDGVIIARIFKDVASYLDNDETRRRVLDTVMEVVPDSGRLVLVSHSLGTVVAVDLLSRLPAALEVELFVTAGSPLGLDAVYNKLLVRGAHRPDRIEHWLNTWYAGDPIAIGCPLRRTWTGQLQEIAVDNPKERAHDIAEYLAHGPVAGSIRERLGMP
jgi:endonuclease G, mitochondrial